MKKYEVEINEQGETFINGIKINEDIFQEEKCDYTLRDREGQIDDLIRWIAECKNSDRLVMLEDLKYLLKLEDEYIFSSILTNEYIAKSDNICIFDNICEEILNLNEVRK
jgi:hypothetical protein